MKKSAKFCEGKLSIDRFMDRLQLTSVCGPVVGKDITDQVLSESGGRLNFMGNEIRWCRRTDREVIFGCGGKVQAIDLKGLRAC